MSDTKIVRPSRAEMWERFTRAMAAEGYANAREGAEKAAQAAHQLGGDEAYDAELLLMVAQAEKLAAQGHYRRSIMQGLTALGVSRSIWPKDDNEAFHAEVERASADAAYSFLANFGTAPALERVVPLDRAAFDDALTQALTPVGYDPKTFTNKAPPEAKAQFANRLTAARAIVSYRREAAQRVAINATGTDVLRAFYEAEKVKSEQTKVSEHRRDNYVLPLLYIALAMSSVSFFASSFKGQFPGVLSWAGLIGFGVAIMVARKGVRASYYVGIGVPLVVVLASIARVVIDFPYLTYVLAVPVLALLVIMSDKHLSHAARMLWHNMTAHKDIPRQFAEEITLSPRLRGRVSVVYNLIFLLFGASILAAAYDLPTHGVRDPSSGDHMVAAGLTFGALFVVIWLYRTLTNGLTPIVERKPNLEGSVRQEKIIRDGKEVWVQRGSARGAPGVVLANTPETKPAQSQWVTDFDPVSGQNIKRQVVIGNTDIKAEIVPLKPKDEMGSGGFVTEGDIEG